MMIIWVSALACVAFVIRAYFVTKFCVNTNTSFTGILDSVGASQRDAALCWRRCKSMLWPNMRKTRSEKCWYHGCQRMEPKITSCYMPHSSPVNFFIMESTHIFHFHVFEPLKEHFCMKCFNTDVQLQLDSLVWRSRLNWGLTARFCIIPLRYETNTTIGRVIFCRVYECVCSLQIKLSHKIYDDVLFRTPSYLCVYTKLYVCTSKNSVFLVTEFIYDKIDLFRIIGVYITAEVYFGYVINCCGADRLKFGSPGWVM